MKKRIKNFGITILICLLIFTLVACTSTTYNTQYVAFVGSRNSYIYHYTSCEWARAIYSSNLVGFSSVADAKSHGYRACYVCNPPRY